MSERKKDNGSPSEAAANSAGLPPVHLPIDPAKFWSLGDKTDEWTPPIVEAAPALKRLGPLPFSRGGFPLMGFLATVYEHVTRHVTSPPARPDLPPDSQIQNENQPQ